jgi:general secretion pathway protein F
VRLDREPYGGFDVSIFEYRALNPQGGILTGTMEAATVTEVAAHLDRSGIVPITMQEVSGHGARTWRDRLSFEPGSAEITGFTIDLAMLLKGGVAIDEALLILTQMETRHWLVRLIEQLHADLSSGKSLSKVLAQHKRLFSPLYIKMVEVAEISGRLEPALTSIALERQRSEQLRKRLISAVAYPGFLAVASLGVLAFVLLYIIPQFEGAIAGFRSKIGPSALFVFRLSETFRNNVDVVLAGLAVLLIGFMALKRFGEKRALWIEILSIVPFTSRIVTYHLTLTFCRTLEILLENGVDISTSLRLIRDVMPVPKARPKIDAVIADVRSGKRLSQALAAQTLLPGHVLQILRVGEEAGKLASSAGRVAVFYEAKLDTALGKLTAILGPVLMMAVSVLIGWLILSIMSALLSINDVLA